MINTKHFWIILFLSAQLAALSGIQYGFFKYRQANIRKDIKRAIKEGVPKDQLVDFVFHMHEENFTNLEWTKPEKEFRFNDQMYDIIETTESNDTIYYKCIHDVKESGLFQKLDLMTNNRSSKEKSIIIYWSKQIYSFQNGIQNQDDLPNYLTEGEDFIFRKSFFHTFLESPTPPPPEI
ncbi:hypothetical protein [Brumimicrobium mesophilum]|uniref:hypothetical protein n=1 Tax=Brumimicrobium mesophilum TaxID=392717 RepID=UPI000D141F10|nr:hypothetical protein [Brumimicrobium mesophilum]